MRVYDMSAGKHTLSGDGESAQPEIVPRLKLGIFKDNETGVIFLALVAYTEAGVPMLDKMLRLTQTTEDILDFYQMLKKILEGTKPRSGMYG